MKIDRLISLAALSLAIPVVQASTAFPAMPPTPGASVDNCTAGKCLFSYVSVPSGVVGESLTSWSFYALGNSPVAPVLFNSAGRAIGLGAPVTPSQAGWNTAIFDLQSGTNLLGTGDTVGFYSPNGGGTIAWDGSGGPGVTYKPFGVGENLVVGSSGTQVTTFVPSRTYDVTYTATASSEQVSIAPPGAGPNPSLIGSSVISDGAVATYFACDQLTSQYNNQILSSMSFYALTNDQLVPMIYSAGANSKVIGYGQTITPVAGEPDVLQTFAYVPVVGSAVLKTGEWLGWYDPVSGSIAFSLTGGDGISYNPNFSGAPQTGIFPVEVTPKRSYFVGFNTEASGTPEPASVTLLGAGLIGLAALHRSRRGARSCEAADHQVR